MQKPGLFGMNGLMVFLFTFLTVVARSQQPEYLMLIDADSKQSFTIRMGDELFASSSHGHIVLSHLKDSSYRLYVRFPKKNMSELVFQVPVKKKDLGFQLKGSENDWTLYNWQTKETLRPVPDLDSSRMLDRGVKSENGFSRLMAAVVNDSSVMYTLPAAAPKTKSESLTKIENISPVQAVSVAQTAAHAQGANPKIESLATISSESKDTITMQHMVAVTSVVPEALSGKDSLAAVKKAFRENLLAARKATKDSLASAKRLVKDSIALVKRQAYSVDSLAKLVRKAEKDSLQTVRKQAAGKDGLIIAGVPTNGQRPTANGQSPTSLPRPTANEPATANGQRPTANDTTNGQRSTVNPPKVAKRTQVKKIREVSLKISRKLVFLDTGPGGQKDTVTIFVYFEKEDILAKKPVVVPPRVQMTKIPAKTDSVALTAIQDKDKPRIKAGDPGCVQLATDADLEFVRSAILKANSEQEKITVSSNAFAMRCFSVSQVRQLATLLISDKAKYRLMEAARPHIADRDHFAELADMYKDKNFQRKFLVMADKRT